MKRSKTSLAPAIKIVGEIAGDTLALGVALARSLLKNMRPGATKSVTLGESVDEELCTKGSTVVLARKGMTERVRDSATLINKLSPTGWSCALSGALAGPVYHNTLRYLNMGVSDPLYSDACKVVNPAPYAQPSPFGNVLANIAECGVDAGDGLLLPYVTTAYQTWPDFIAGSGTRVDYYRRELLDSGGNVVTGRVPEDGDYYGIYRHSREFILPGERPEYVGKAPGRLFLAFSSESGTAPAWPYGEFTYNTRKLRVVEVSAESVLTGVPESVFELDGFYAYRYHRDPYTGADEYIAAMSGWQLVTIGGESAADYLGPGALYVNRQLVLSPAPAPLYVLPIFNPMEITAVRYTGIDCYAVINTFEDEVHIFISGDMVATHALLSNLAVGGGVAFAGQSHWYTPTSVASGGYITGYMVSAWGSMSSYATEPSVAGMASVILRRTTGDVTTEHPAVALFVSSETGGRNWIYVFVEGEETVYLGNGEYDTLAAARVCYNTNQASFAGVRQPHTNFFAQYLISIADGARPTVRPLVTRYSFPSTYGDTPTPNNPPWYSPIMLSGMTPTLTA